MQVLNELMPSDNSYNDILSFDMDNLINEAGRRVALAAPLHLLTTIRSQATQINQSTIDGHIIRVAVPSLYFRLISIKVDGWAQPVYGNELLTPEHSLYARQMNKMTAGGCAKPMAALANNQFELFSCSESASGTDGILISYFPNYDISKWESVALGEPYPTRLIEPVVWQTASLLFNVMEEHDNSTIAQNRCNELLALAL